MLSALRERVDLWENKSSDLHEKLQEAEEAHQIYIPKGEADKDREQRRDEKGEPTQRTMVIPFSYAMVLSQYTFWASVFLSRTPIFQFSARHGETQQQVQAVEAIMSYQTQVGGHMVPYFQWLLDTSKYGMGIIGHFWDEDWATTSRIEERQKTRFGVPTGETEKVRVTEQTRTYQGTKVFNVMPWDFIFDPRIAIAKFQQGEFCGRRTTINWMEFVEREQRGLYFNKAAVKRNKSRTHEHHEGASQELDLPDEEHSGEDMSMQEVGQMDLTELFVTLIPKEWGLGEAERPEIWVFSIINDAVIVSAAPLGEVHGQYPFDILTNEVDQYTLSPRSLYEVLNPLQDTLDWLVNTHFYNVRRSLNDMFVADPSRIVIKDLLEPGPGKIIRAKPSYYGGKLGDAVQQFPVQDVTRGHMDDAERVMGIMQQVAGVSENALGTQSSGGRKTATEVRQSNSMSVNRMKMSAEYFSAQGWAPLAQKLLQTTQQNMDAEMQLKIAGDLTGNQQQFVDIAPEEIAGFFDFVPIDGSAPIDRTSQANLWIQMFGQLRQFPQMAQGFDLEKIFGYVMQLMGLKNVSQFKLETRPDEQVQQQAANGELVPSGGASGSGRGGGSRPRQVGDSPSGEEAARDAGRVGGLGPLS